MLLFCMYVCMYIYYIDLNDVEEKSAMDIPKFTLAVLPRTGKTVLLHLESRMHLSKFEAVKDIAVEGARQIHDTLNTAVKNTMLNSMS